jgi:dienelactone hydrolase
MTSATVLAGLLFTLSTAAAPAAAPPAAAPASGEPIAVDLRASDGVVLKGSLYKSARPGPGVVMLHMCDAVGRSAWDGLARRLSEAGMSVLTWNYRGVGDSGGEPMRGGSLSQVMEHWRTVWGPDAELAVNRLMAEEGVDRARIGLAGASCGGYLALLTARRMPGAVRSVVFMAGPADEEVKRFLAEESAPPVLGVAATGDARSAAWTREVVESSKNKTSRLLTYDEAGHGTQLLATQKELTPEIVRWFEQTLGR